MNEPLPGAVTLGRVHRRCRGGQEWGEAQKGEGGREEHFPWDWQPELGRGQGQAVGISAEALQRSTEVIVGVVGVAGSGQLGRAFLGNKSLT